MGLTSYILRLRSYTSRLTSYVLHLAGTAPHGPPSPRASAKAASPRSPRLTPPHAPPCLERSSTRFRAARRASTAACVERPSVLNRRPAARSDGGRTGARAAPHQRGRRGDRHVRVRRRNALQGHARLVVFGRDLVAAPRAEGASFRRRTLSPPPPAPLPPMAGPSETGATQECAST